MRTATTTPIQLVNRNFSTIENQPANGIFKNTTIHSETAVKHYLLYNLDILLEVSKHEKLERNPETAASIIREYEFLNLVNDMKKKSL